MGASLFVLSGPSGVGKDTILKSFLDQVSDSLNISCSISATTRKPRENEEDGKDYFFISEEEFHKKKKNDEFLESACVHNNLYGTPKKYVEKSLQNDQNIILELDIQGAKQIKDKFPEAVLIFLIPPSLSELENRLTKRGSEDEKNKAIRLQNAREELKEKVYFDYQIVNDNIKETVEKLKNIILKEISYKEG